MSEASTSGQEPIDQDRRTLSRRDLLATAALAGAGAAVGPILPGCANITGGEPPSQPAGSSGTQGPGGGLVGVTLNVNGQDHPLRLDPRVTLLDSLREEIGLTGTKKGCDHGQCGACTVLVDGRRVNSCLTLAVAVSARQVTTIEGLAKGEELHPVQAAFIEHDAFQCGYCTPGQICSAVGLIAEGHAHTDDEIREGMAGNICRCGAYPNIVAAVRQALPAKA